MVVRTSSLSLFAPTMASLWDRSLADLAQETTTMLLDEENRPYLFAAVVVALVSYTLYQHQREQSFGTPVMHHPPEGRSLPYLGHAIHFLQYRPWDLLTGWHRQYGPIVGFTLVGNTLFSIASPSLIKAALQSKIGSVKKDIQNTMKPFLVILGTGIVTSENKAWMKQRLKMSHPLRFDVLEMIPRQTLAAVQRWMEEMDAACDSNETIAVGSSLRHLTLQVISGTFLSLSAEESDSTFAKLYLPIVDESNLRVWHPYRSYLFFLPFFWRHLWNVRRLNVYVSYLIRQRWQLRRKESGSTDRPEDILDRVLVVYEKEFPGRTTIPESDVRQLRDEMKTFMLAGHETSAAMMTWCLYELVGSDSLMEQVRSESDSVFDPKVDWATADEAVIPQAEELAKLKWSEASLRESLRKYSVVPIVARRTIEDLSLEDGKYLVPKGSSLMINIQAVHLDPSIWPEPMKFRPSRFIDQKIAPFTFLPFIAGPRNCLGQHLALLESKMVISLVTQRYRFRLPEGETVEAEDWTGEKDPRHRFIVPVIPKKELMVHVSRR